jgi:hypothetical protein
LPLLASRSYQVTPKRTDCLSGETAGSLILPNFHNNSGVNRFDCVWAPTEFTNPIRRIMIEMNRMFGDFETKILDNSISREQILKVFKLSGIKGLFA